MCQGLIVDGVVVIPPMEDADHLLSIVRSHGFVCDDYVPGEYVRLEAGSHVGEIVPCEITTDPAPHQIGYYKHITPWVYKSDLKVFHQTTHYIKRSFDDLVAEARVILADAGEEAMGIVSHGYRQRTVESWPQQRAEAEAYREDKRCKEANPEHVMRTPKLLMSLADTRGVELDELVLRVLAKVDKAAYVTGIIIGSQQAAEDKIDLIVNAAERPVDWWDQIVTIVETWKDGWPEWLELPEDEFIVAT